MLLDHLVHPNGKSDQARLQLARKKLRKWEADPKFRDQVYQRAVVDLDMSTPAILKGIAGKAKRGRVDAARLALEITGRHTKAEQAPTQVAVVFGSVPRPGIPAQAVSADEVEGEEV
jgi:hypothetical protein